MFFAFLSNACVVSHLFWKIGLTKHICMMSYVLVNMDYMFPTFPIYHMLPIILSVSVISEILLCFSSS